MIILSYPTQKVYNFLSDSLFVIIVYLIVFVAIIVYLIVFFSIIVYLVLFVAITAYLIFIQTLILVM